MQIFKKKIYFFRVSPQSNQSLNDSQQKTKTSTQDIFLNGSSARYADGDNANRNKCKYILIGDFISIFCLFVDSVVFCFIETNNPPQTNEQTEECYTN